MRISTVGYSVKQGVKNIGRNKMFSLASVATMAASVTMKSAKKLPVRKSFAATTAPWTVSFPVNARRKRLIRSSF